MTSEGRASALPSLPSGAECMRRPCRHGLAAVAVAVRNGGVMRSKVDRYPTGDERDGATPAPSVAHYVMRHGLTHAYALGLPVVALCGQVFIPTRDPSSLPLCDECRQRHHRKAWTA